MPFQLTIAEGKEAGREFVFEQPQVVIGREAECDVVLYDPGVSRKHARIFVEGNGYFVEDMGSSNGTKVNGSVVKKQKLASGDAVALGPVVFSFTANKKDGTDPQAAAEVPDQNTRVFNANDKRSVNRGSALAPEGLGAEQLGQIQRSQTRSMQPLRPRSSPGTHPAPAPQAIARPSAPSQRPERSISTSGSRGTLSAAERARIRRDSPALFGRLKLFWLEASGATRAALAALLVVIGLGGVAGLFYYVVGDDTKKVVVAPEPKILGRKPIEASFGLGDGVTYARPDMKVFGFEFLSATKAVVILHFQAMDISDGEVVVTVNGADVGKVPADGLDALEVSHEIVIPPQLLKRGQKNEVIFDNVRNPPGTETWRIWNIWIEIVPLPEESLEDLVRDAQTSYGRAELNMERKDVGAGNRYEAWKGYRESWLKLEAHPDPKPELYQMARSKMHDSQKELNGICSKLMLEATTYFNHNDFKSASGTLDHVKDFFPNNDQPCGLRAETLRVKMGL